MGAQGSTHRRRAGYRISSRNRYVWCGFVVCATVLAYFWSPSPEELARRFASTVGIVGEALLIAL